jgi:arabinofuranosyltransferase
VAKAGRTPTNKKITFMRNLTYNFLLAFFLCTFVSLFMLARFGYPLIGIDDANIYFVYAKNLANGHGFVYNVGGERVEGFTSFLWTLLSALAFRLSAYPEAILLAINIALLSVGITVALRYLQNDFLDRHRSQQKTLIYSAAFLILLLTSPRYIVWNTITLMENALWSTLLLVTTIFVIKDHPSPGAMNLGLIPLLILLVLTRPESVLWGAVFIGIFFLREASEKGATSALKNVAPSLLTFVLTIGLLRLLQFLYFGYLLPNTFYAKVSPSFTYNLAQGVIYLSKYIISDPIVLLSVIAIVLSGVDTTFRMFSKRIPTDGSFFLSIVAVTGLLAPVITGGDHFGSFRLYQNIYPIEVLCLLYFADRILPRFLESIRRSSLPQWTKRAFRFSSALMLLVVFLPFQLYMWNSIKSEIDIEFNVADYGRKNGAFIQQLFSSLPRLPSLGVVTSGGIKYSYDGEVVDLMGLNNTIMAHNRGDRKGIKNHAAFDIDTFYQLQPDIVWPLTVLEKDWQYSELGIKESWENREGFKGLFDQPQFLELYSYAKVKSKTGNRYALIGWFKKDFLKQLGTNPDFQVEKYTYMP